MSLLVFCPRAQHTAGTPGCIEASVFEVGLKLLSRNLINTKDSAVSAPTPGWVIKTSSLGKLLGQLATASRAAPLGVPQIALRSTHVYRGANVTTRNIAKALGSQELLGLRPIRGSARSNSSTALHGHRVSSAVGFDGSVIISQMRTFYGRKLSGNGLRKVAGLVGTTYWK
jgi:hypothetical protein